jgi:hypothetical protein
MDLRTMDHGDGIANLFCFLSVCLQMGLRAQFVDDQSTHQPRDLCCCILLSGQTSSYHQYKNRPLSSHPFSQSVIVVISIQSVIQVEFEALYPLSTESRPSTGPKSNTGHCGKNTKMIQRIKNGLESISGEAW